MLQKQSRHGFPKPYLANGGEAYWTVREGARCTMVVRYNQFRGGWEVGRIKYYWVGSQELFGIVRCGSFLSGNWIVQREFFFCAIFSTTRGNSR